ncbi:MAG: uroporphyrinogen decarboxylase [Candidatus Omnitrophica bacterium CG11_big_fil_rev_8_21_14_0_20_45_26]|uniref:Uroporphyrinogen decarboxylase n=1 Tax=Candidatus Abzuiibacterium crystallinum TaxID=1974748 RepID=A0A2H0LNN9_9BACT|nr:MAG: uroporphyrinogen decarboxylase [Candidatus Omnitrophica bacterium CG11_big_fil_rev_8_21_14_0_20_45_26]PIW65665.1 MAG: uroporphyrinogen decarboxylase [Candidatus Omnitrophica bacterium CG12_big_fil_rev_8_21_14_0_65_45_16]
MTRSVTTQSLKVLTLASRQAETMVRLIERSGHIPISAPVMRPVPLEKNEALHTFVQKFMAGEVDMMIFLTGMGTEVLLDVLKSRYTESEVVSRLNQVTLIARGPKPLHVLKQMGVMAVLMVPDPNTWRDILQVLDENEMSISVAGRTVALQEYGNPNFPLIQELEMRQATVFRVPLYQWALPEETQPIKELIQNILTGEAEALLITSSTQIHHLFQVAAEMNVADALTTSLNQMIIGSIGPMSSQAVVSHGVQVSFESTLNTMEDLIHQLNRSLDTPSKTKPITAQFVGPREKGQKFQPEIALLESPFLKACRLESVPYTPVWLMRQAGRYMKSYRDLRNRVPFITLCKDPDLAAEVTVHAQETIGADAAIIFSDILLMVEPLGFDLTYAKHDGPVIADPIRDQKQVLNLPDFDPVSSLSFLYEAIRKTRRHLKPHIPLIGFSGAPFTLASYLIEGGSSKSFSHTKTLMYTSEEAWHLLMEKLVRLIAAYLNAQVDAGAQALQLFDSWVGCLGPDDYERYVLPHMKVLFHTLGHRVPVIHFGTNTSSLLTLMRQAGGDVIGLDFRMALDEGWQRVGFDKAVQGNLDPLVLCGPVKAMERKVKLILEQAGGRPGHIFNLGHGILPQTPVENVIHLIKTVHQFSRVS